MISIIICSRTKNINDDLTKNIEETIGCEYELIIIDNSENKYSIFEAYNLGIELSKGNYLCFMHDDVVLHTKQWGVALIDIFHKNKEIGLIGVAGSRFKSKMPSGWWNCPENLKVINIIQHLSNGEIKHWNYGWNNNNIEEVVMIDGVFMLARKVNNIMFDTSLKGFHNYDLNISMEYLKKNYKIVVSNELLLEHLSIGKLNSNWYESTMKFHQLNNDYLPIIHQKVTTENDYKHIEFSNGIRFCKGLMKFNYRVDALKYWLKLFLNRPISRSHFELFKLVFK